MSRSTSRLADPHAPAPLASARTLASARGWSLTEYICTAGPDDAPFEEAHDGFTIAAVLAGTFRYKADTGDALLHPGALLLGNNAACYACGHAHGQGDRCLALNVTAPAFAEIAASAAGTSRFRFAVPMLPAQPRLQSRFFALRDSLAARDGIAIEVQVMHLVEDVLAIAAARASTAQRISSHDEKRIGRALRHMERRFAEPLDLEALASIAGMSKYHFLRTFRRVAGQPPHQYLLGLRLAHVAQRLRSEPAPVSAIALEAGFGDLSTFNARFRRHFRESPSAWRRHRLS